MANPSASPPALPRAVRGLGWTSFLTDFSSEAIYPLLPAFIRSLGGTGVEIGLVDGLANAVAAVARLPAGLASDRIGRRPLVLLGYGLSALVQGLMALPAGLLAGSLWAGGPHGAGLAFAATAVLALAACCLLACVGRLTDSRTAG